MTDEGKRLFLSSMVAVGLSFVLSYLPVCSLFYTIPVIVIAGFFHDGKRLIPALVSGSAVVGYTLIQNHAALQSELGRIGVLISLFFPVVLWVSALVWIALEGKRSIRRYLASCVFGTVVSLVLLVWLTSASDKVVALDKIMSKSFATLLGSFSQQAGLSFGTDAQLQGMYRMAIQVTGALLVPICMVLVGVNEFIALNIRRRNDQSISEAVVAWHLPLERSVWVFLSCWTLVAVSYFAHGAYLLTAMAVNLAASISLLYALQGFAIVLYALRKKNRLFSAGRLFGYLVIILSLVPGLNVLVVVVLPLLGVTETWIMYRKNE